MPSKRKRPGDLKSDEAERSPTPTSLSKKRKKELQYDPTTEPSTSDMDLDQPGTSAQQSDEVDISEIIQELFETIRNYKSEEGKLLCESFIRVPKKRTSPDYYEVVTTAMDMLKIQQKMKMDEYEEIEQLTADVELMVNNARAYYKKGSQEYIDATDLLDLYYEIRDELLVETFGENKEMDDDEDDGEPDDANLNIEQLQSKIGSIMQQEEAKMAAGTVAALPVAMAASTTTPTTVAALPLAEDKLCDPEDFEQLFACLVNAQDGERGISEPFHLLPYKTLYPNYYEIIKEPIDLKMIARKIQDNLYKVFDDMENDINLMVSNAKTFNEPKSLIFKDACTLKKVFDVKRREMEHRKTNAKTSERLRTRGGSQQKLSAQFAALEYPEPLDPTDIMEYEEDSGAETVMSEEENPMWNLFNVVKNFTMPDGSKIIDPYMKLPSKRYYPDYYEEIKRPLSVINVQKKLKIGYYNTLDDLAVDFNLVFENAKQYNADESIIYKNACLLQKVLSEKKKELEKFGLKEMSIPELGIHFEFPMLQNSSYEEETVTKKSKKSVTPSDTPTAAEKKRSVPQTSKKYGSDDLLRKRLWMLYKSVYDYADNSGRLLRQIFMYLPSKRDYPDYYKVITDPVDLSTIETKIKNDRYPSEYNLLSDFDLMFKNARHYNEEGSQVYSDAVTLEKALKGKWRVLNQGAGTPRPKSKTRKNPAPATLAQRLSDLYETIRDYQDMRGRTLSSPFMKVPLKSDYPDYYEVIKKPIDLSHIQQKMMLKRYETLEDMVADFVQMFDNACKYNEPDSLLYKDALTLQRICLEKKVELSDDWINEVPDVRAVVQEMMTTLFISTYNHTDEEGIFKISDFLISQPNPMDALTLQRICLEKKVELSDDWTNEVPDVRAVVQEMMTTLFISTYNHTDEEGRCYTDAFGELPDRDPEADPNSAERPLSFDKIKRNLDRGRYRRMDRFQDDMFKVFDRARRLSRTDSQLYEDAIEMQMYFIRERDELCKNGEVLLTPALSYHERHLMAQIEAEKSVKVMQEQREDEDKKNEEGLQDTTGAEGSENSLRYKDQIYNVGDFVHVEPRDADSEPHIMCIEKIFTDASAQQQVYGNWFYRPNETFHLASRKFLQKEVFKSDFYTSITPNQILNRCYVMYVKDYFKYKPVGIADHDVYVCESRYTGRTRTFKKIKLWSVPKYEEAQFMEREVPLGTVRVASVFADKDKDEFDDGDLSILDKARDNIALEGITSEDGSIFYEQLRLGPGTFKIGDAVYVKSDQEKPSVYRIDKIWIDMHGSSYFHGPLFIRPSDIEHPPTRLFYKNEMFLCGVEEARTLDSIIGKCCVLHTKEYCCSRPTEILEHDIYICESKYHEAEKMVRKLTKGLQKHVLSPRVTEDEVLFFKKPIIPVKEPSPLLSKVHDDGYDGEESRDTTFTDVGTDMMNTSVDEYTLPTPVIETKTPKKVEEVHVVKAEETTGTGKKKVEEVHIVKAEETPVTGTGKKKAKSNVKRTQISGYIVFSGEFRKIVQHENPDCTFGEISRLVGAQARAKRFPSGYLLFSGVCRKKITEEQKDQNLSFGEISRLVGIQWRNLEKEEKEKYEEKARRIQEEQQAKQEAATKAFNETLTKTQQGQPQGQQQGGQQQAGQQGAGGQQQGQQQWADQSQAGVAGQGTSQRPATPGQQGYPQGYYSGQGYPTPPGPYSGAYAPSPGGQFASMQSYPGMPNGMGGGYMSPMGQRGSPMPNGTPQGQPRPPYMAQYQQSPGGGARPTNMPPSQYPGMPSVPYGQAPPMGSASPRPGAQPGPALPQPGPSPYPGMTQAGMHATLPNMSAMQAAGQQQQQQQQQMAPPPPPPRPPSPMFVTVPPRTQRLLHSEAYLKYIEGLNSESRTISDWDKTLSATPENTPVPDDSRLPTQWLSQGAGYHGSVTDALWALRDMMLKDALNIQRTLPFEAL